jgi:hypothetical protein
VKSKPTANRFERSQVAPVKSRFAFREPELDTGREEAFRLDPKAETAELLPA